jgi:hypothetical protein
MDAFAGRVATAMTLSCFPTLYLFDPAVSRRLDVYRVDTCSVTKIEGERSMDRSKHAVYV